MVVSWAVACVAGSLLRVALARRSPSRPARSRRARASASPASAAALFPDGQALGQQVLAELSGQRGALERAYLASLAALPEPQTPSPEERAIVLEALVAIDAMLDGMKPGVRQAFILSQLEGLTYAQIAAQLGVTVRTVNNYMLKALEHCYLIVADGA